MGNCINNTILIASSEAGLVHMLGKMLGNLQAEGHIDSDVSIADGDGLDSPGARRVLDVFAHTVDAYIATIGLGWECRPFSDRGDIEAYAFTPGTCCLRMRFATQLVPDVLGNLGLSPLMDPKCTYFKRYSWYSEGEWYPSVDDTRWDADNPSGAPLKLSSADEEYGKEALLAAYCRLVTHEDPAPNGARLKRLIEADDAATILKYAGDGGFRELLGKYKHNEIFKAGKFRAYAAVINSMDKKTYRPRDAGAYARAFCEAGADDALSALANRCSWTEKSAAAAKAALADFPDCSWAADLIDARMKELGK